MIYAPNMLYPTKHNISPIFPDLERNFVAFVFNFLAPLFFPTSSLAPPTNNAAVRFNLVRVGSDPSLPFPSLPFPFHLLDRQQGQGRARTEPGAGQAGPDPPPTKWPPHETILPWHNRGEARRGDPHWPTGPRLAPMRARIACFRRPSECGAERIHVRAENKNKRYASEC